MEAPKVEVEVEDVKDDDSNRSLLQDSVWLICCWVCVCASGIVDFDFQF